MDNKQYINPKILMSYNLTKNRKFFKKARAIVVKGNKVLLIRVDYKDGRVHYLLPGGGVDEGETAKAAAVRETLEEYSAVVKLIKYIDKQYYNVNMEYNGEKFVSHRVEYYYLCEFQKFADDSKMGLDGEFESDEKTYTKVELSLDEILLLNHNDLNQMSQKVYDKLVEYLRSVQ